MINAKSKFDEDNLTITFTGASIVTKIITISIKDDVDYKELIDYLVELIPKEQELNAEFEEYDLPDKKEKLDLINETTTEILVHFNNSIKNLEGIESPEIKEPESAIQEQVSAVETMEVADDDLPF